MLRFDVNNKAKSTGKTVSTYNITYNRIVKNWKSFNSSDVHRKQDNLLLKLGGDYDKLDWMILCLVK